MEPGIVIIGRNEGERFRRCLASLGKRPAIVYVDSGSSDDSVAVARAAECDVVELDLSRPFSAARARNEGVDRLLQRHPDLEAVQFVDGDCEVAEGWIDHAAEALASRPELAVVCGRRRERHPDASIYNRLCDMEWDTPVGEAAACGGDSMMRVRAFREAGGFNPEIVAGEEPELCLRMRRAGWKIARLDAEMTLHDAAMTRFSQWWMRMVRSGHAYAEGVARYGNSPDRYRVRETLRIWTWGAYLPLLAGGLAWPTQGWSLLLLALYPLQGLRTALRRGRRERSFARGLLYAAATVLGKWAELQGQLKYALHRARGTRSKIIEYKGAAEPAAAAPSSSPRGTYCIVSPCRDEAEYLRTTLDTVLAQTAPPDLWVIVDDGSTDDTPRILAEYAERHPSIRIVRRTDRGRRSVGPGVIHAFYAGLETVDLSAFDYLCKLDLDLDLPPRYFEILLDRMARQPRLGTCSGKPYFRREPDGKLVSERCGDEMSVGMTKLYRRECFEDIGGFVREVMWDGIDCHRCRMLGWIARSWDEPDIRFIHLRPMGSSDTGILKGRLRHGFGQYFMGTGFFYMTASALFRMTHPPLLIGGLAMWWGYVRSLLSRTPRYGDTRFRRFLARYQWACLVRGKKSATTRLDRDNAARWNARRSERPASIAAPR